MFHAVSGGRGRSGGLSSLSGPNGRNGWKSALRCGLLFSTITLVLFVLGAILTWLGTFYRRVHDVFGESVPITGPILLSVGALMSILGIRQFVVARSRHIVAKTKAAEKKKTENGDEDDDDDDDILKSKSDLNEVTYSAYEKPPLISDGHGDHTSYPGFNGSYYWPMSTKQTATSMALWMYKDLYGPFTSSLDTTIFPAMSNSSIHGDATTKTDMAGTTSVSSNATSPGVIAVVTKTDSTYIVEETQLIGVPICRAQENTGDMNHNIATLSMENHSGDEGYALGACGGDITTSTMPEHHVCGIQCVPSDNPNAQTVILTATESTEIDTKHQTMHSGKHDTSYLYSSTGHCSNTASNTLSSKQLTGEGHKIFPSDSLQSSHRGQNRHMSANAGISNFPKPTAFFMLRTLELQETI